MPQLTHHNFYSNFTASIKSGDLDLTNDILANELSDFIVFDTDKIITALNKADIKIDKNVTDEKIVDTVIENISANGRFKKSFAFIIAEGNELLTGPEDKQIKTVTSISDTLSKVGKGISENSKDFKESTMNQIVSKASKRKEYKRTIWNKDKSGMSATTMLLVGGVTLAVFIVIVYFNQKRDVGNAIPNMIMGGDVNAVINPPAIPTTPTPVSEPIVTAGQPIALKPDPILPGQNIV